MPDVERGVTQRLARPGVDKHDSQLNRDAELALSYVAPKRFIVDVVRTLLLLGEQRAGRVGRKRAHCRERCAARKDKTAAAQIWECAVDVDGHVASLVEKHRPGR
jgi:hypothetical protein